MIGILFSTVVREAVVARLIILGILPLISFILASRAALVARLVILDILSSIYLILALYTSFKQLFYRLHLLIFLKSTEKVLTYQHLIQQIYQYLIYQAFIIS